MSQEKVDRYKKEKANRKKTNARNKVKRAAARVVIVPSCKVISWSISISTSLSGLSSTFLNLVSDVSPS